MKKKLRERIKERKTNNEEGKYEKRNNKGWKMKIENKKKRIKKYEK